jgi:hypothetical protein
MEHAAKEEWVLHVCCRTPSVRTSRAYVHKYCKMEAPLGLSEHAQKQARVPRTGTGTGHMYSDIADEKNGTVGTCKRMVTCELVVVHGCRNTARLSRSNLNHPKLQPCCSIQKKAIARLPWLVFRPGVLKVNSVRLNQDEDRRIGVTDQSLQPPRHRFCCARVLCK